MTSVFHLVWGRLKAEAALTLALWGAWVVFASLLAAIPIYSDAANQFVLTQELGSDPKRTPTYTFYLHYVGTASNVATWREYDGVRRYAETWIEGQLGIPRRLSMHYVTSDLFQVHLPQRNRMAREAVHHASLGFVDKLDEHATLVEGRFPAAVADSQSAIEVLLSQAAAEHIGVHMGEELVLFRPEFAEMNPPEPQAIPSEGNVPMGGDQAQVPTGGRAELLVRVVGIWAASDAESGFWYIPSSAFEQTLLVPKETYLALASEELVPRLLYNIGFYQTFDGSSIRAEDVGTFLQRMMAVKVRSQMLLPGISLELTPESALRRYQRSASTQALQLLAFLIPFVGLVIHFIVNVAGSMVQRQRLEVAMLKSRGASSAQVFGVYFLQAILMGLVCLLVSPFLGRLVAQAVGTTYAFLSFASPGTLPVVITRTSLVYALFGVGMGIVATVVPAVSAARMTVIGVRQVAARADGVPLWQRKYVDVLLLGVALYGYYLLRGQGRIAILRLGDFQSPLSNPLLFLAPSLFIVATSLVCVRLFPLLISALAMAVAWGRGVTALLTFSNLSRSGHNHVGLLVALILGSGVATFTASMARTIDENTISQIRYMVGADVALKEGAGVVGGGWKVLPVETHLRAPSVKAAARIGRYKARVVLGAEWVEGTFYGIDRLPFAQVAYFRPDFAPVSLGRLLNELAAEPSGVLVSRQVLERFALTVGDPLPVQGLNPLRSDAVPFRIVGVVDYFPTAYPEEGVIFVGNLDYAFQEVGGSLPYDVWVATRDGIDIQTLTAELEKVGLRVISAQDSRALIREAQRKPQRTGVFGFLSIGFIITVGLSMATQVIYAMMSYRRRFIQFGVFRAIGLSAWQLAASFSGELMLIIVFGLAAGLGIGLLSGDMFIPFLQIGYRQADLVPPFEVLAGWQEIREAMLALLLTSLLTSVGVVALLLRIRVFEALKLGESTT